MQRPAWIATADPPEGSAGYLAFIMCVANPSIDRVFAGRNPCEFVAVEVADDDGTFVDRRLNGVAE